MARKRLFLGAAGFSLATTFAVASCSLGLDASLIGQESDSSLFDRESVDTGNPDASDARPPLDPEGGVCTTDTDCKGATGCLTARCDTPRKACVFDVCLKPTCNSAKCEMPGSSCDAPKPFTYRAGQFPVGDAIGCGSLQRCFAAVYPYVFVGTPNGVLAFQVADPASTTPPAIPITGLGFVPNQIVASGSRVYFLGSATGTGTSSRLPIAYADVPPDPFAVKIPVTTILATYARPATDGLVIFPRGNDTSLLVDFNVATAYGSTPVEPPLTEPAPFASQGITFTMGSSPQAVSGTRLVMAQVNAAQAPIFGFVGGAGSASPTPEADVTIASAGAVTGPFYYSQSADGALFWGLVALNPLPPPIPPAAQTVRAARGYFLVGDANAPIDPAQGIDLEVYGAVPIGTPTVGPVAMIDKNTVLVTTALPTNTALTNVSFVTKSPLGFVKNTDTTPRRFQITLAVSQLAAAASGGFGYVLAVDPAAPTAPTVYVFDPGCAP